MEFQEIEEIPENVDDLLDLMDKYQLINFWQNVDIDDNYESELDDLIELIEQ